MASKITAGKAYGFFTDTSVCIGCKACEVACKEWNQLPEKDDEIGFLGQSLDNTGRDPPTDQFTEAFQAIGGEEFLVVVAKLVGDVDVLVGRHHHAGSFSAHLSESGEFHCGASPKAIRRAVSTLATGRPIVSAIRTITSTS